MNMRILYTMKYLKATVFAALFCSCAVYAQPEETFVQYTLKDGGREQTVTCCISDGRLLVPVEDFADFAGLTYEVCERCGNTAITKTYADNTKDVLLVEWNSPYVYYQNKNKKITLSAFTKCSGNRTYTDPALFKKIRIGYKQDKVRRSFVLN